MSADPNQKPAWIDELEKRPQPVRFVRFDFSGEPYKCRKSHEHRLPCGSIICEWSDGELRALDTECACGCDAFELDSCLAIPWVSV